MTDLLIFYCILNFESNLLGLLLESGGLVAWGEGKDIQMFAIFLQLWDPFGEM